MRAWLLVAALAGCGYTSHYTPPPDGKTRAIWRGDHVIATELPLAPVDDSGPELCVAPPCGDLLVLLPFTWPAIAIYLAAHQPEADVFPAQFLAQARAAQPPGALVLDWRRHRLEMSVDGKPVARSLRWRGLAQAVRDVPRAEREARAAEHDGRVALALAIIGGTLGGASLASLGGFADERPERRAAWLGSGAAVAAVGVVFAGTSLVYRNRANGHAVDALNVYDDDLAAKRR